MYFRVMKISSVNYIGDYTIRVKFEDGVEGDINLSDLISSGIFRELKDSNRFAQVFTTGYSIAWSAELEIDAATIYSEITGKDPSNFFSKESYTTN
jgi:Protein of unknown function (DUF2442)